MTVSEYIANDSSIQLIIHVANVIYEAHGKKLKGRQKGGKEAFTGRSQKANTKAHTNKISDQYSV